MPVLLLFVMMIAVALRNLSIAWRTADPTLSALGRSMQTALIAISIVATSITVEGLPFWILIFLSQNLREIVSAEIARTKLDDSMVMSAEPTDYGTMNLVTARLPVRTPNTVRT
ncbi:MAG: hypothetical protein JO189_09425 [Deltaproteobacteria bacterium]|nr:hypothetical protein [Deltaproteobacteria bacterium]